MTREEAIRIFRKEIECLSHTKCEDCILEKACDPMNTTPYDSEYIEAYSMAIKALEQEPTTKNDLGVDCISRADAERILTDLYHSDICDYCLLDILEDIKALPSVTPQEPRWIPVSERLPKEHICDDGFHEPSKSVLVQMKSGAMHTARYWSRYDERWLDLNYPTTDEVIAWMPLPKSYKAESEG